jgi:hypothetical protein
MSLQSIEEARIRTTLACGKCGSKAIVSENGNDSTQYRIHALKCLVCGNRQEQGTPCRWPFFQEETGNSSKQRDTLHKASDKGPDHDPDITRPKQARRRRKVKSQAVEDWLSLSL